MGMVVARRRSRARCGRGLAASNGSARGQAATCKMGIRAVRATSPRTVIARSVLEHAGVVQRCGP